MFTGAGGALTPADYTVGAQPAVAVGAGVLLASALIAMLLPPGRAVRQPAAANAAIDAPQPEASEPAVPVGAGA